jgi:transcriptional regulator with XRE-family HTH domain
VRLKILKMERFRIKEIIKEKGMTMQQLAEELGIHRTNLSTSLSGNPTLSRLEDIAKILDVKVTDLFRVDEGVKEKKLNGFVEFDGEIFRINSIEDLVELLNKVKEE